MRRRSQTVGLAELLACREQILACVADPSGHRSFSGLAPGTRVVVLLPPDITVDLQHAVVIREHVTGNRAGERVLGIGVDVHLDHTVGDGLADLLERRTRSAVEYQVERLWLPVSRPDRVLYLLENRRPELDVAWLVDAVHVAERRSEHVAPALA